MRAINQASIAAGAAFVAAVSLSAGGGVSAAQPTTCDGMTGTIVGTNGPDELIGTPGDDVIVGLGGDDFILGLGGDDVLCGGNGADEVFGDDFGDPSQGFPPAVGDDSIFGGNGDDFLVGMGGVDSIHGENGTDIVIGGPSNDVLFGDRGDDFIFGTFGNDNLAGGQGDDLLNGDLPFPPGGDGSTPPGVFEDPTPGNTDSCDGGSGTDAETFCEVQESIETHPDPSEVVLPV
jgi:Ca2+-binding RTX toxin-like protein